MAGPGKADCFVIDAFHEAAIADEGVGVMVDDGVPVAIEGFGQETFSESDLVRNWAANAKCSG